jgi:MYXO-CTERM domain-containing protein
VSKKIPNCSLVDVESAGGGPPPTVPSAALLCSISDECPADRAHCVDGVCCNEACTGGCRTCVGPGSIGVCAPSKRGVDLRHDCAPAYTCEFTCDGEGACVSAQAVISGGADVQCAPNECAEDGIHVLGLAFCAATGEACPTSERDAWSCAPYRCVKALGACGATCELVSDCAPPFVCDPTKRCVPPPAVASGQEGGCSAAPGASDSNPAEPLLILMLAGVAARRRRRKDRRLDV